MWRYRQYCPVARAAEIVADRWTPLIVRELLAGVSHFNQIERGLPGISRTLLSARLQSLEDAGVVRRVVGDRPRATEYRLTPAGSDLAGVVDRLGAWGSRWAFGDPRPDELDPVLLLWKMRRRIHLDRLPPGRVVVEFEFAARRRTRLWLVLKPEGASVCVKPPGFDPDLAVKADLATFYQVWLGRLPLAAAVRGGKVQIDGAPALVRRFPAWLKLSPMAEHVRAGAAGTLPA
jgi:DNA-binding HxlR family transcriptional regulator